MIFYTYAHYRDDTNTIFYIGKGSGRRYKSRDRRNQWWNNIANKHGWRSEILCTWDTEQEAYEHEMFLIQCLRDIGTDLCNANTGGHGGQRGINRPLHSDQMSRESNPRYRGKIVGINAQGHMLTFTGSREMKQAGFHHSHIYRCVNGKKPQYRGYVWTRIQDKQ